MEDFNWISESEKMYNINNHFDKIYQSKIKILFIYINNNNNIDKIVKNSIPIQNNTISKQHIFDIIYKNRIKNNDSIYNFNESFLFNIPFEHDKINQFNSSDINSFHNDFFLSLININSDIIIPKSLFIFHNLSTILVFYKQKLLDLPTPPPTPSKSILKKNNKPTKTKKKVTIKENFRKTKKYKS